MAYALSRECECAPGAGLERIVDAGKKPGAGPGGEIDKHIGAARADAFHHLAIERRVHARPRRLWIANVDVYDGGARLGRVDRRRGDSNRRHWNGGISSGRICRSGHSARDHHFTLHHPPRTRTSMHCKCLGRFPPSNSNSKTAILWRSTLSFTTCVPLGRTPRPRIEHQESIHVDERVTAADDPRRRPSCARSPGSARSTRRPSALGRANGRVGAIAGGVTTDEEGFLLQRLMREGAGLARPRLAGGRIAGHRRSIARWARPPPQAHGRRPRVRPHRAGGRLRAARRHADPRPADPQGHAPPRSQAGGGHGPAVGLDANAA